MPPPPILGTTEALGFRRVRPSVRACVRTYSVLILLQLTLGRILSPPFPSHLSFPSLWSPLEVGPLPFIPPFIPPPSP